MEIEEDFTRQAKASGLSEEEAKNAYNQNMLHGGLLAEGAAEFARQHNRRWLLTAYEAGDVVFHNSYAVRHRIEPMICSSWLSESKIHASTINHDQQNKIRLGTDIRFVDSSRPWDTVGALVFLVSI